MKYEEILKDVLSGKSVRQSSTCRWIRLKESGMWDDGPHNPDFVLEKRDYAIDSWEVKPDEPEEIYVMTSAENKRWHYECGKNLATHILVPVDEDE